MAVVSRIATIKFDNGLPAPSGRTWVATAATQDTAAGSSVVTTITNTATGGALDPAVSDTFTLRYVDDGGTVIRTVTLDNNAASQTDTFFFTSTGASGGTALADTIEIRLQVTKTTGGPTNTYDVETDGSPNTPPTGFTTTQLDRGWIRGSTTQTQVVSNIALGGGKNSPAQYDESLFMRVTHGHGSYRSRALTVASSSGSLSSATNSTASATRDVTFSSVVDNRFPAASTVVSWTITIPNATLTGQPAWALSSTTADTITVDPRLTAAHLLQIDVSAYSTPPFSAGSQAAQRVFPHNGYVSTHLRTARGTRVGDVMSEGKNGLTFSLALVSAATGQDFGSTGFTTTTKGGETGWQDSFLVWTAVVGGNWTKTVTITAPSDITGASYLLQPTATYALQAADPNLFVLAGGGNAAAANSGTHWSPGTDLLIAGALRNKSTAQYATPDAAPTVSLLRLNPALGRGEYLRSSDLTWVAAASATADSFTMTVSPGDPNVYTKTFTAAQTASWGTYDIVPIVKIINGGTIYSNAAVIDVVAPDNKHDGYAIDPIALALSGILSQR